MTTQDTRWCLDHIETYSSIAQFRHTVESRELNKGWESYSDVLSSEKMDDDDWDGGAKTIQQAWDLAQTGYAKAVQRAKEKSTEELKKIGFIGDGMKVKPEDYYAGGSPNVTRAMMKLPRDMRRYRKAPTKQKIIQIAYQCSFSSNNTTESVLEAGAKVIALVQALEKLEYSVQLSVISLQEVDDIRGGFEIKLKSYDNPLDIQKVAYFFAHPSFHRRIGFKWIETYPEFTRHSYGYGRPHDDECVRRAEGWLKERGGHFISFKDMQHLDLGAWLKNNNYLKNAA